MLSVSSRGDGSEVGGLPEMPEDIVSYQNVDMRRIGRTYEVAAETHSGRCELFR